MISTLLLALTISAAPPVDRCAADISHAEASAFESTRVQHACMDPAECRVADELVRAATAQLEAVRAMCAPVTSQADPFEASEPAPLMAGVPEYAGDDAAFRAVMGE